MFPFFSSNKEPSDPVPRAVRSRMEGHFRKMKTVYNPVHI